MGKLLRVFSDVYCVVWDCSKGFMFTVQVTVNQQCLLRVGVSIVIDPELRE